ncbi:motility protein A [Cryptosporangium arvum]|uniref:Flagellar motor component n=1 Tax=Cryptosporangium arvum DSM 44712 TaxID=927661 RepID=A0A010Z0I8_9ACTN|nr:MotA/TolQ/ExbB proton channel family protein [Cryptosporangium arvum]EXG80968.1 flagellar motor component [Cryptosporangium arvum DSM 44712]
MDPASIIGIVVAFAIVFTTIILEGGHIGSIFLPAPLLLVFGGAICASMTGATMQDTIAFGKNFIGALTAKKIDAGASVDTIVKLAERARKEGLLALEDAIKEVNDPFLKDGLQLAVDGTDPEELREILEGQIEAKKKRDKAAAKFFTDLGSYAPTIGIIGTTTGLIHALENLAEPEKLGHVIAAAFVATLWGLMSSNLMWLPIASRVKRVSELEVDQMNLSIEGIMAIQAGANPRLVAQKLKALLPNPAPAKAAA